MKTQKALLRASAVAILVIWISGIGFSQVQLSTLTGTILDPSGAHIPGATVVLMNDQTGTKYQTVSGPEGTYTFAGLPLSTYTLTVGHPGFATSVEAGMVLSTGSNKSLDVTLQVGAVTQQVQVTGVAPLLETRSPTVASNIEVQTLEELPIALAGTKRDPNQFLATIPGYQGSAGFSTMINGGVGNTTEITVDGAPSEVTWEIPVWWAPFSIEAVDEFKYSTDPTADLPNGSAVINYSIKSGTNRLHGSVYDYMRNNALDSRCFFCSVTTKDHQSEYGFSVGGPVYIPHVFDGRDKLFFFMNIGWSRYHYGLGGTIYTVPTDAYKGGNFSGVLGPQIGTDALGRQVNENEVYDPSTTRTVTAGQIDPVTGLLANANATIRDPFPGNQIPKGDWSPVSTKLQSFYGEPNGPGIINNFLAGGGTGSNDEKDWTFKVDWYQGKNHMAWAYWLDETPAKSPWVLPMEFAERYQSTADGHNYRYNWDRTISPNIVSDFVIGINRFVSTTFQSPQAAVGAVTIGLPNASNTCTPRFTIGGGFVTDAITNIDATAPVCSYFSIWQGESVTENVSYSRGKHFIKFGGSVQHFSNNALRNQNESMDFLPGQSGLPNMPTTGLGYASFLLGVVSSSYEMGSQYILPRNSDFGLYVSDEIRVRPNLTVTAGLRWDGQAVLRDHENKISDFCLTCPNPGAGGLPGAVVFFGYGPGRLGARSNVPNHWIARTFAPRLGVSYKVAKDTVVRAGYGMSYGSLSEADAGYALEAQNGFVPTFNMASGNGYSPAFNWTNGYPLPPGALTGVHLDPTIANGSGMNYLDTQSGLAPRIQQWHFDIQRKVAGDILLQASYLGNNAHGLLSNNTENMNQLNYQQYGSLGSLLGLDAYSPQAQAAGIKIPYAGFKGSVAQALTPYPQMGVIQNVASIVDWSTYNAFQFQATKHFAKGLSFLVGYTISKQMDSAGDQPGYFASTAQDTYNLRAEKALSNLDLPQQLLFNYVYEFPIGPGKRFANGNNIVEKYVIGGWSLAGIHTYQSGYPLGVTTEEALPTTLAPSNGGVNSGHAIPGGARASSVAGVARRTGFGCQNYVPGESYLNPAAFATPPAWTFGNTSKTLGNVRNCGNRNENVSLFKSFPLHGESAKLSIGVDAFNLFNRHIWGNPNTDVNSSGFGTITGTGGPRLMTVHARISW